ncbi:hypothetical protein BC936DRAFT_141794, partial [Jimgerdemannia flammicorona]
MMAAGIAGLEIHMEKGEE